MKKLNDIKSIAEKIINYLIEYDFQDVKLVYIEKEKNIKKVSKDSIDNKLTIEKGFSVSFVFNNVTYFFALNNLNDFTNMKRNIKNVLKCCRVCTKKTITIDLNFFDIPPAKIEEFKVRDYQKTIIKFLNEYENQISIAIPLLCEKKRTFIIKPFDKNMYKEEFNYKIDIMLSTVIDGINRFNYYSKGSSFSPKELYNVDVYAELIRLYESVLKMKSISGLTKKCDLVLSNGIGGLLFHEACGHALETREIVKKASVFNDITNVNNKRVNFIDNPTLENEFGSFNIDDEGNDSKCVELIKNGEIIDYLADSNGMKFLNCTPSSCRRESYYNLFSPRMSNTYIKNGNSKIDEIISSVKDGFFIKNILGGSVDTLSGNFSFNCLEAYKIENGVVDYTTCYDNLTIVSNAIQILRNIDMIGNDLTLACGICGSESGFIYTTVGQPTIKVKDVLVVS